MYRIKILRTLILCLAACFSTVTLANKKVDVFKEFEKSLAKLEGDLKKEKDPVKRYDLYLASQKALAELRAKNPRQAESKEINMSLYVETLSYLPAKKDFAAAKCSEYKKEAQSMMKSYDKTQKEPFVEKGLNILNLICP